MNNVSIENLSDKTVLRLKEILVKECIQIAKERKKTDSVCLRTHEGEVMGVVVGLNKAILSRGLYK